MDEPTLAALIGGLSKKHAIGGRLARAFEIGSGADAERIVRRLEDNEHRTERLARRADLRVCGLNL